ncbi:hypothetical protein HHI36_005259 [Cryptolaemus montrouzieri]|uniref:Uncharacterized protein n=1 Tax=Cryptolaemus montrouzieri TaxID=559131 RepID=A0ABD2NTZ6_9CUCU
MVHQKLLIAVFFYLISSCASHGHSHEDIHHNHHHNEEPPSFKYSKAANEELHQEPNVKHYHSKKNDALNNTDLWLHAMGSTLLISAAPFFILFLVPLDNTEKQQPLLKVLLAFAAGGLLGDAFLHLIPHATTDHSHNHGHSHSNHDHIHEHDHVHDMSVGLWVLTGIVIFLIIEKFMRILKGGHSHSHTHKPKIEKRSDQDPKKSRKNTESIPEKDIKVAGYLNLAADFSHNFTDGLAIGSSYLAGNTIGEMQCCYNLQQPLEHY